MVARVRGSGVIILLLVVLLAGLARMYWPFFERPAEMRFFGYLDAWVYTGPVLFYGDRALADGDFPTWNPYVFCGQPIAGNPQYLLFYPPNTLRSLLTPGPIPWNTNVGIVILLGLHALWAGLGAYLISRAHNLSRGAAFSAGVLFVFSAPFTQRLLLHHHLIMVIAWLPWTWLSLRNLMLAPDLQRALGWSVLLGVAFGFAILAGSPQMTFLVGLSLALYWVIMRVQELFAQWRSGKFGEGWRGVGRDVGLGAIAALLAVAVAAALVLPAFELINETPRATADGQNIETGLSNEKWSLTEVLSMYPGSPNHEGIKAIGASGLLLCIVGLFSVARRDAVLFAALALLLFDASDVHSRFMLDLTSRITPFPISSPGRTMMLAALPLSLLAGLGVDRLHTPSLPRLSQIVMTFLLVAAMATMFEAAYGRLQILAANGERSPYPIHLLGIGVAAFVLLMLAVWFPTRRSFAVAVALLALVEPVAWRSAWSFNTSIGRGHFYRLGPKLAKTRPDFHGFLGRQSNRYPNTALYSLTPQINGYDPLQLHGFRELVAPREEPVFFRGIIESQRRSLAPHLFLKRSFWLQREFIRGPIPGPNAVFPPTTTAYIEDPPALGVPEIDPGTTPLQIISSDVTRIPLPVANFEFKAVDGVVGSKLKIWMPPREVRRHTVLRIRVVSDCQADLEVRMPERISLGESELMAALKIKPTSGQVVVLDVPLPDVEASLLELQSFYMNIGDTLRMESVELLQDQQDETGLITVLEHSANAAEVELRDLPARRILSFIDFNYPGWHAYLDGGEVPILRAFSHFKGVEVPPGTHRVRFEFRPRIVPIGIAISTAAALLCLVLVVWAFRRAPSRAFGVHSGA